MRAILIDAVNRDVREIECRDFEAMKRQMGVDLVCVGFHIAPNHDCYVDDEGLLNDPQYFFECDHGYQPYAGNGAILRLTKNGDSASCTLDLDDIKRKVRFGTLAQVQEGIRAGKVDYNTYLQTETGIEKIADITLGAFEEPK